MREHARRLVAKMASRVYDIPYLCLPVGGTMRENDRRRLYIKVTTKKALLAPKYATRSSLRGETNPTNLQCASAMWVVDTITVRDKLYSIVSKNFVITYLFSYFLKRLFFPVAIFDYILFHSAN